MTIRILSNSHLERFQADLGSSSLTPYTRIDSHEMDVSLSTHTARLIRSEVKLPTLPTTKGSSRRTGCPKAKSWMRYPPSRQSHYRTFITTTRVLRPCAPHRYSGTRGGCPLVRLPSHQDDRFPRSTSEPESRSRHLYAGRRLGRKQVPPRLFPEVSPAPGFDAVPRVSTPHRWFACARLLDPHLPGSSPDFCLDAHHNDS